MVLTRLEEDLLGDMAQDDHALREVFEFVRLHHGNDPEDVRRLGRELLSSWDSRGWITVVPKPPSWPGYQASSIAEVLQLVDEAGSLGVDFRGAETWLGLTEQAFHDVEWIAPSS
jgi:hypothetical protein